MAEITVTNCIMRDTIASKPCKDICFSVKESFVGFELSFVASDLVVEVGLQSVLLAFLPFT